MTLFDAASAGKLEKVRVLLAHGAFADDTGPDGQTTALCGAAAHGHAQVVQLLLDAGADPSLPDADGETALLKAAAHGHHEVFAVLAPRAGADELALARTFLQHAGFDPTAAPPGPPREEEPSKVERGVATFAARAAKFFGHEEPAKRLERAERSEDRKKR